MLFKALLVLALGMRIFALPSTSNELTKRNSWPWIGSFQDNDTFCENGVINPGDIFERPELRMGCFEINRTTQRIGL